MGLIPAKFFRTARDRILTWVDINRCCNGGGYEVEGQKQETGSVSQGNLQGKTVPQDVFITIDEEDNEMTNKTDGKKKSSNNGQAHESLRNNGIRPEPDTKWESEELQAERGRPEEQLQTKYGSLEPRDRNVVQLGSESEKDRIRAEEERSLEANRRREEDELRQKLEREKEEKEEIRKKWEISEKERNRAEEERKSLEANRKREAEDLRQKLQSLEASYEQERNRAEDEKRSLEASYKEENEQLTAEKQSVEDNLQKTSQQLEREREEREKVEQERDEGWAKREREERKRLEDKVAREREERKRVEDKFAREREERKRVEDKFAREREERKRVEDKFAREREERKRLEDELAAERKERKRPAGAESVESLEPGKRPKPQEIRDSRESSWIVPSELYSDDRVTHILHELLSQVDRRMPIRSCDPASITEKQAGRVLVPCIAASRVGSDLTAALAKANLEETVPPIVIIYHHKAPHNSRLGTATRDRLSDRELVRGCQAMVDAVFWQGAMYDCAANRKAVEELKGILGK